MKPKPIIRCQKCNTLMKPRVLGVTVKIPVSLARSSRVSDYVDKEHEDLAKVYPCDVLYVCGQCTFAVKYTDYLWR